MINEFLDDTVPSENVYLSLLLMPSKIFSQQLQNDV